MQMIERVSPSRITLSGADAENPRKGKKRLVDVGNRRQIREEKIYHGAIGKEGCALCSKERMSRSSGPSHGADQKSFLIRSMSVQVDV